MSPGHIQNVVIASAVRTPIGSFQGALSTVPAPKLAAVAIRAAVKRAGLQPEAVDELYLGCVLPAGLRQSPCKQAALEAGLPTSVPTSTVNKRCASGLKAVMMAAQTIMCGHQNVMVAGGMESMSNAPFYIKRGATPYGGFKAEDSILCDGLMDFNNLGHMGNCAETIAKKMSISREEQDEFATRSYRLSQKASAEGVFNAEIVEVSVPQRKGDHVVVSEDEEYKKVNFDRMKTLSPVFQKEGGTITAANASTLNDGAAAMVLMSEEAAQEMAVKPLARIVDFADASRDPVEFSLAPALAVKKMLDRCGVKAEDVAMWEINEAFSVVVLANMKMLGLGIDRVNVHGGAVSLGHPVGMSGTRIAGHMAHTLKKGEYGVAAICNGGGGASAMIMQKL